jgi:hypothetical protein
MRIKAPNRVNQWAAVAVRPVMHLGLEHPLTPVCPLCQKEHKAPANESHEVVFVSLDRRAEVEMKAILCEPCQRRILAGASLRVTFAFESEV